MSTDLRSDRTSLRPLCLSLMLLSVVALVACQESREEAARAVDPATQRLLREGTRALERHDLQAAEALADSAARRAPELPDAAFLRGRVYEETARADSAEAAYRRVLARDASYRGAWHNLGNIAFRRGDFRTAIRRYRREGEAHPAPAPWRGIGRAYRELGQPDSARLALEQALGIDSAHAPTHLTLAQLLEEQGGFDAALVHARHALRLDTGHTGARYQVASLLAAMDQSEAALPLLRDVAADWPWHHATQYALGQALVRQGKEAEGRAHLERAEELRALDVRIRQAQDAVTRAPGDPYAHAHLASALRMAGRYDDALRAYRTALYLSPGNLDVRHNLAVLHLVRGEEAAAVRQFQQLLAQDPTRADAWLNLGVIHARAGREGAAREAWQRVLQYRPGDERAKAYLARLNDKP